MGNLATSFGRLKASLAKLMGSYVVFPAGAALIVVIAWIGVFRTISLEGQAADQRAAQSALELLETYEAQLIRALSAIDQSLRTVDYVKSNSDAGLVLDPLNDKGVLPPALIFTVMVADRDGVVRESTDGTLPTIGKESFFEHHSRVRDERPVVSLLPARGGDTQDKLVFSRRLSAPDGGFMGVALIKVSAEYFTSGYETARLGSKGLLGLVDANGIFLIKRTGDTISSGTVVDDAFLRTTAGNSELIVNLWDGVTRYTNSRPLFGYPLTITVGLSRDEQLQGFLHQRQRLLWAATIGTLVLALITLILTFLARQLDKSRAHTRKEQETYYAASEASLDAVIVLHALLCKRGEVTDFRIESVSKQALQMLDHSKEALLGKGLCELAPAVRQTAIFTDLIHVFIAGEVREAEWENDCELLHAKWLYRQVVRIENGVVLVLRDITERKEAEERITYMAHHDVLTGLLNRMTLNDRVEESILRAQTQGRSLAVAFIDLDNFKIINDGLGHNAGDELLKVVASRITEILGQSDTVVRLGGDEFVILINNLTLAEASDVIHKVCKAISRPMQIQRRSLEMSASIGVAVYPTDGKNSETLLLNADAAMYEAKHKGRNNVQFYTAEMNAKIAGKLAMQEDMRRGLEQNEFYLLYQPQVELATGCIVGVEALVRWQHPVKGTVPPGDFIGLAEETGLIAPLGEWVMREACRQSKAWQDEGLPPITMSINVSAYQFSRKNLVEQVERALADTRLEPRYLDIELTESLIMQDTARASHVMQRLTCLGVKLSIDDFGTGYSSLAYLKAFPISRLKLDRSFVNDLSEEQGGIAIARAVVALGHELEMEVLAEGVENDYQRRMLYSMGFDLAQGYLYGRPVSADEVQRLLGASKLQVA